MKETTHVYVYVKSQKIHTVDVITHTYHQLWASNTSYQWKVRKILLQWRHTWDRRDLASNCTDQLFYHKLVTSMLLRYSHRLSRSATNGRAFPELYTFTRLQNFQIFLFELFTRYIVRIPYHGDIRRKQMISIRACVTRSSGYRLLASAITGLMITHRITQISAKTIAVTCCK